MMNKKVDRELREHRARVDRSIRIERAIEAQHQAELERKEEARRLLGRNGPLAEALLKVRELVPSGSEEMGIIDEALGKVGITPWKAYHPCGRCKIDEECDHCRSCGEVETDPDGLCEICEKCSLCCEDCGTFFGDEDA